MGKKDKITVQGTEITVITKKNNDYICLTDMANPTFKGVEFDTFLHESGAISPIHLFTRNGGTAADTPQCYRGGKRFSEIGY